MADICGLQLLYVWMQSELGNLSENLQLAIQGLGLGHCFAC